MQCNINRRGRSVRAWIGGFVTGDGILLLLFGQWLIGCIAILAGLFVLFEAWKGWCAIRALGLKTPV